MFPWLFFAPPRGCVAVRASYTLLVGCHVPSNAICPFTGFRPFSGIVHLPAWYLDRCKAHYLPTGLHDLSCAVYTTNVRCHVSSITLGPSSNPCCLAGYVPATKSGELTSSPLAHMLFQCRSPPTLLSGPMVYGEPYILGIISP